MENEAYCFLPRHRVTAFIYFLTRAAVNDPCKTYFLPEEKAKLITQFNIFQNHNNYFTLLWFIS